jgi:hypothetical protein
MCFISAPCIVNDASIQGNPQRWTKSSFMKRFGDHPVSINNAVHTDNRYELMSLIFDSILDNYCNKL